MTIFPALFKYNQLPKSSANAAPTALAACRLWNLIDASKIPLGRLCSQIALVLQGKHKPIYHPASDCGDHVVVINASKLWMTGNKLAKPGARSGAKMYRWYTGYHLKEITAHELLLKDPAKLVWKAVKGMLPKNRLRNRRLKRLHIFSGADYVPYASNITQIYYNNHDDIGGENVSWNKRENMIT